jgi:hypothetical protein
MTFYSFRQCTEAQISSVAINDKLTQLPPDSSFFLKRVWWITTECA